MNKKRQISINTSFFPSNKPYNCGYVIFWRYKNGEPENKMYGFPTQASLNRLASVLRINTTITSKPDNIEVASGYFKHDSHVTEVTVTGKLN